MKKLLRGILAFFLVLILGVLGLGVSLWFNPEWVLTSKRVSGWTGIPLKLKISKPSTWEWRIRITPTPGCYSLEEKMGVAVNLCIQEGLIDFTLRFRRKTYLQLSTLHSLTLKIASLKYSPGANTPPSDTSSPPFNPNRYLTSDFRYGPVSIDADKIEFAENKSIFRGKISGEQDAPASIEIAGSGPSFKFALDTKIRHENEETRLSDLNLAYDYKLGGALETLRFNVSGGNLNINKNEAILKAPVKILALGKTKFGKLPELRISLVANQNRSEDFNATVSIQTKIASYKFKSLHAKGDLDFSFSPKTSAVSLNRGDFLIEAPSFRKIVELLEKTPWSIPAPFTVLDGPIRMKTLPFKSVEEIPIQVTTALRSPEQAIITESQVTLSLDPKSYSPLSLDVNSTIKNITLRLPDYEPLAPVPIYRRDPRIVRYDKKNEKPAFQEGIAVEKPLQGSKPFISNDFPVSVTIDGDAGSCTILNRLLVPSVSFTPHLVLDGRSGVIRGDFKLSSPLHIEYLNKRVKLESFLVSLKPDFQLGAVISMERAGYHIEAAIAARKGKTKIDLTSKPPLSQEEIVSLVIYGMPRNSISSEQSRSLGSADAAITSQALGVFSFWAFASTPIESVIYDPTTETYSAVVRLPGGVVASIGSNWENDRQVALSKSLGRNWAVSTELIKDSEGVDRGGTLLRWRKSY